MSCGCDKPSKSPMWTPVPDYRKPSDIQIGENIDCFMARVGDVAKNDAPDPMENKIENTSFTSDRDLKVDIQFKLTNNSTKVAAAWTYRIDGPVSVSKMGLTWGSNGKVTGTVSAEAANKHFKVLVNVADAAGALIDSREFNFYPKKTLPGEGVAFVFPYKSNSKAGPVITCIFGPRKAPVPGASTMHQGIDIATPGRVIGTILAAADGVVTRCGPGSGWGNVIFISHKDSNGNVVATTVYGHWSEAYVKVGQAVAAGQAIAKEGSVGHSSAPHLHFELHKGSFRNAVDPMPYLNGKVKVNIDGTNVESTYVNSGGAMTYGEAMATGGCPVKTPQSNPGDPVGSAADLEAMAQPIAAGKNRAANRSDCAPAGTVDINFVISEMDRAFNEEGISAEDRAILKQIAKIESNMDPFAKNPSSTAMGLFQMLASTAASYYASIGKAPNCANRCNPYLATKAMCKWWKREMLGYWNGYISSGKTKIANIGIKSTAWSAQYPTLSKSDFLYGLIHHDGVGNAVSGVDRGGVNYWRTKAGRT